MKSTNVIKHSSSGRRTQQLDDSIQEHTTSNEGLSVRSGCHLAKHARLRDVGHVDEDIVRRVAVQRRTETLLVEVVADETDAATEDEQTVERANLDVLVRLLRREGAAVAEQVDEADSDTAVNVEDERVLLRRRHLLDRERVVEQAVAREVLAHVLLHELNTEIRVVHALDLVADTADCSNTVSTGIL